jgi:hypothetical protein
MIHPWKIPRREVPWTQGCSALVTAARKSEAALNGPRAFTVAPNSLCDAAKVRPRGAHLYAAYECAEAIQQALTFPDEIEANNPSSQGC